MPYHKARRAIALLIPEDVLTGAQGPLRRSSVLVFISSIFAIIVFFDMDGFKNIFKLNPLILFYGLIGLPQNVWALCLSNMLYFRWRQLNPQATIYGLFAFWQLFTARE